MLLQNILQQLATKRIALSVNILMQYATILKTLRHAEYPMTQRGNANHGMQYNEYILSLSRSKISSGYK